MDKSDFMQKQLIILTFAFIFIPHWVCAQNKSHVVQSSETLYSIARQYDITVEELKELNNLDDNTIKVGQKLIVSKEKNQTQTTKIHKVKRGENLSQISRLYDISVGEIKELNDLRSNTIKVGQELVIAVPSTEIDFIKTEKEIKVASTFGKIALSDGEDVTSLLREYQLEPIELEQLNWDLDIKTLRAGQTLNALKTIPQSNYLREFQKNYIKTISDNFTRRITVGETGDNQSQRVTAFIYSAEDSRLVTTSGEILNLESATLAHKSLPLGTIVNIKNVSTGKSVLATVNNRTTEEAILITPWLANHLLYQPKQQHIITITPIE